MIGAETKRPRSDLTRPVRSELGSGRAGVQGFIGFGRRACQRCRRGSTIPSRSGGFPALEPGSVDAVAAFEVTDPAFGAGSVAREPALGAFGAGLVAAGDEHPLGDEAVIVECLAGRARVEGDRFGCDGASRWMTSSGSPSGDISTAWACLSWCGAKRRRTPALAAARCSCVRTAAGAQGRPAVGPRNTQNQRADRQRGA